MLKGTGRGVFDYVDSSLRSSTLVNACILYLEGTRITSSHQNRKVVHVGSIMRAEPKVPWRSA